MRYKTFCYSPTGNTKKIADAMVDTWAKLAGTEAEKISFTLPEERKHTYTFSEDDLVVVGVPTYAGRVPNLLVKFLKTVEGNGARAVALVTFGNRAFDDSLIELGDLLTECGFRVVGGAAAIGEHSFSRALAAGRPDANDLEEARTFAKEIYEHPDRTVELPGNRPYRPYYRPMGHDGKPALISKVVPVFDLGICTDCKLCAEICPMGAIDHDEIGKMVGICVKCCACERRCPVGAIGFDDSVYLKHRRELVEDYPDHKANTWV